MFIEIPNTFSSWGLIILLWGENKDYHIRKPLHEAPIRVFSSVSHHQHHHKQQQQHCYLFRVRLNPLAYQSV